MILKEDLERVVLSQKEELSKMDYGIERDGLDKLDFKLPLALVLSGVRRCGKSTLLRQLMRKAKNPKYFNFEDSRIGGFGLADFGKLDDALSKAYGESGFYFFDEIQNVEKWEIFVRQKLDEGKHFAITGSNASLLSSELGTRLTGRHLRHELFPFSYREFLKLRKKEAGPESFGEYFTHGGFPGYLKAGKEQMLQELFNDIVVRDIIARYKLRNQRTVKELALYLASNVGKEFSYNNLKQAFGLGSTNSAIAFVAYLEDSYLLFTVPKFDYSMKKRLVSPKKAYSVDNGLSNANSASFSADRGRMLENMVFLQLRRQGKQIFYYKGNGECDFVVKEKEKITQAFQVCYDFNQDNEEREFGGLIEALEEFRLKEGTILTYGQEDVMVDARKEKTVYVKPVWKWLLQAK